MMKKIIFVVVVCLSGIALFGQTKPTKQETIDWLTAQIRENSHYMDKDIAATYEVLDDLKIECTLRDRDTGFREVFVFTFNDICDVRFSKIDDKYSAIIIKLKYKIPCDNCLLSSYGHWDYYIYNGDLDMPERMFKAFKTLAEYNCPPVKEVF